MPEDVEPEKARITVFRGLCDNIFIYNNNFHSQRRKEYGNDLSRLNNGFLQLRLQPHVAIGSEKISFAKRKIFAFNEMKRFELSI